MIIGKEKFQKKSTSQHCHNRSRISIMTWKIEMDRSPLAFLFHFATSWHILAIYYYVLYHIFHLLLCIISYQCCFIHCSYLQYLCILYNLYYVYYILWILYYGYYIMYIMHIVYYVYLYNILCILCILYIKFEHVSFHSMKKVHLVMDNLWVIYG